MRFIVERSRRVHRGRVFDLFVRDVRLPDGARTTLDVVEHPGAAVLVPILDDGRIVLVYQLRVAAGGMLYELPAGTLEKGEPPAATARRELREETGYRARRLRKIAEFFSAPGFCTERMHVYVATGLAPDPAEGDEDERIRVRPVAARLALRMARDGRIRDAKSIAGLLLAEQRGWLGRR